MAAMLLVGPGVPAAHGRGAASAPGGIPLVEDAPIAYLMDATTGQVLFAREEDRRFMPASIVKAMTTLVAFDLLEQGKLTQTQAFTVRPQTFSQWRGVGSTMFLGANDRVTVDDLLHGVTTVSANDGAIVLAEGAARSVANWAALMNRAARRIGMADSYFASPNGWMDEGRTFVTAHDLALLGQALTMKHPAKYQHYIGKQRFRYGSILQPNHDPLSGAVPGADGIKTGFTNQAGYGYLGSVKRGAERLILVVAGSPTNGARNRASRQLVNWGFTAFDIERVAAPGSMVGKAMVQDGSAPVVPLITDRPVDVRVPEGRQAEIASRIVYRGPLKAPVVEGETVAMLEVSVSGLPTYTIPLKAGANISEASLIQRAINGLRRWLS